MSLSDAAKKAREKADATGDQYDLALAGALEAAEAAEAQRIWRENHPMQPCDPPPPPPPVDHVRVRMPRPEN